MSLTLSEAIKTGRLAEFAQQEEKRGVGPINDKKFDAALKDVVAKPKQTRSKDRTSRSASRDGSHGK
jgi:hypothetical protein